MIIHMIFGVVTFPIHFLRDNCQYFKIDPAIDEPTKHFFPLKKKFWGKNLKYFAKYSPILKDFFHWWFISKWFSFIFIYSNQLYMITQNFFCKEIYIFWIIKNLHTHGNILHQSSQDQNLTTLEYYSMYNPYWCSRASQRNYWTPNWMDGDSSKVERTEAHLSLKETKNHERKFAISQI